MNLFAPFGFYGWGNIGDRQRCRALLGSVRSPQPVPCWVGRTTPGHPPR